MRVASDRVSLEQSRANRLSTHDRHSSMTPQDSRIGRIAGRPTTTHSRTLKRADWHPTIAQNHQPRTRARNSRIELMPTCRRGVAEPVATSSDRAPGGPHWNHSHPTTTEAGRPLAQSERTRLEQVTAKLVGEGAILLRHKHSTQRTARPESTRPDAERTSRAEPRPDPVTQRGSHTDPEPHSQTTASGGQLTTQPSPTHTSGPAQIGSRPKPSTLAKPNPIRSYSGADHTKSGPRNGHATEARSQREPRRQTTLRHSPHANRIGFGNGHGAMPCG